MMMVVMVTVRCRGCRGNHTDYIRRARRASALVIVIVIVRYVEGTKRLLVGGLRVLDHTRLHLVALFLQQAVDLEPVRTAAVTGAGLRHPDHQTLAQTARLARGSILLVDHAHTAVLAFGDAA